MTGAADSFFLAATAAAALLSAFVAVVTVITSNRREHNARLRDIELARLERLPGLVARYVEEDEKLRIAGKVDSPEILSVYVEIALIVQLSGQGALSRRLVGLLGDGQGVHPKQIFAALAAYLSAEGRRLQRDERAVPEFFDIPFK
jgi:hypothetical protein